MKTCLVLLVGLIFLLNSCGKKEILSADHSGNPAFKRNTAFELYEDLKSPKFQALKEKYQLDTVFHGEQDEFRRQLLLRDWILSVVHISDFESAYPGEGVAEEILDAALKGQGYHCGHYMIVQNAIMNAYGYVTRCLGAGPGEKGGADGHHGINEIWSNKFQKWYLSDAKYNHHFEKGGVPLSALEIRDEYLRNRAADVVLVKGARRIPIEADGVRNEKGEVVIVTRENFAQTYTWIEWEKHNDRYTYWPDSKATLSILNMYEDDYFRNNTWIWDGKPHWAYSKPEHMIRVSDRDAIEWTPNTISSSVDIKGNVAYIQLESETPNLKTYQMKKSDGKWQDIDATLRLEIDDSPEEVAFRTMNLANVHGPEHKIVFRRGTQQGNTH